MPAGASDNGTLALGVVTDMPGETSYIFHPRTSRDVWDPFHHSGQLDSADIGDFNGPLGNIGAERLARLRRGLPISALCRKICVPG